MRTHTIGLYMALAAALLGCGTAEAPGDATRTQTAEPTSGEPTAGELTRAGRLTVAEAMVPEAAEGFARAIEPRDFTFPADHGPHPGFQTEWWYLTGHLREPVSDTTRFGYQLTFFRSSLRPPVQPGGETAEVSNWRSDQLYMAHFALTDVAAGRFYPFERFARGAIGLAGARAEPFRVWLDDWSLETASLEAGSLEAGSDGGIFPMRARAGDDETGLDLLLDEGRAPLLQGDRGLSQKGAEPGNASYYYSLTRLPTRGVVRSGGTTMDVVGTTWIDREWSTSALEAGVVGWDWFAIQLSDGRDVMVYRLRREDDSASPFSSGVIAGPDGERRTLSAGDVELEPVDSWTSPLTGSIYPSGWRLRVSSADIDLEVDPLLKAQEHSETFAYWEGAARVEGTSAGRRVTGTAYVELTGYEPAKPQVGREAPGS